MNSLCNFFINKCKFCRIEFNKSMQLYSWIIGLPFTITSHKMVSGGGLGGAGWVGGGAELRVFSLNVFVLFIQNYVRENKNLCVKKIIFVCVKISS